MSQYVNLQCKEFSNLRFYLPSLDVDNGTIDVSTHLYKYTDREFPDPGENESVVYSLPRKFSSTGQRQASLAEREVFEKLRGLAGNNAIRGLWVTFFHSACYAGQSYRNQRMGRLMIREHDFVVFAKYKGQFFVVLVEVKSNKDSGTKKEDLEKTSDAKVIKNNKRSAQHQLRDHMEVLQGFLGDEPKNKTIQTYIMWPFLGSYTRDPRHQVIKRWKEDKNLHVFEDTLGSQELFNQWFLENVLGGDAIDETHFASLLNRFIILSFGVFMNEINEDLLALLTRQQLDIMDSNECSKEEGGPLVVYGAAGTGKTLLVLRKLDQLHRTSRLNDQNRALYVCYWPGIRADVTMKLQVMGIDKYVDTARYFVSINGFLKGCTKKYKHIFMDESEAVSICFNQSIMKETLSEVYKHYHGGNCHVENCEYATLGMDLNIPQQIKNHHNKDWGEMWFMIDANQAQLFLPKHCPEIFRTPALVLSEIMRSTKSIFDVFKVFYNEPALKKVALTIGDIVVPNLSVGHDIEGPPVYWVPFEENIDETIANVVIDLCSTKGIKPNDICVIPFMQNENTVPRSINKHLEECFVENTFQPKAVANVEDFLCQRQLNDFLVSWALRVKGLEFNVVIMAIEDDDFDMNDFEDRRKAYIISSRCTCMLICICSSYVRNNMALGGVLLEYPFSTRLDIKRQWGLKENVRSEVEI
ncbi:uncharacterized protein LOC108906877 [Anoplophora glabripennis]|uniref:uncharacterized protein LOC108906877 n=1 Tax=Anoplophora glabripennis TaxID=217634 RepID=UPI0008758DD6|nr:uncharacterized protein LOC108906877 [Anoplophora glabripennis]